MVGEVEDLRSAASDKGRGDLEQSGAEPFGLPSSRVSAGQGDHLHPGDQLGGETDDLGPDLVLREALQRELRQTHVFGIADPVLAAGAAAVTQLQGRELAARRVGGECGDPHPVVVGDP